MLSTQCPMVVKVHDFHIFRKIPIIDALSPELNGHFANNFAIVFLEGNLLEISSTNLPEIIYFYIQFQVIHWCVPFFQSKPLLLRYDNTAFFKAKRNFFRIYKIKYHFCESEDRFYNCIKLKIFFMHIGFFITSNVCLRSKYIYA